MEGSRFAVLDVETTCGDPTEGRIMEVAVVVLDGMHERHSWDTLVDPRAPIQPFIRRLTGIDQRMLEAAPVFADVVGSLDTLTRERILVAHNVRFDLSALTHEFARTGLSLVRATLCTERLSRQLVPGLPHYNLGSLCRHFGIPFTAAHRALPDARATAALLGKLTDAHGIDRVLRCVQEPLWARRA
jgi:DNA polymerase-3 subunit epsilon